MKKLFMLFWAFLPLMASGYDVKIDGIYYNLVSKGNIAIVTYQMIEEGGTFGGYKSDYKDKIIIPSTINYNGEDYSVAKIGDGAFGNCGQVTEIIIPSSVISIGVEAFQCCGMKSISLPNSIKTLEARSFAYTNLNSITIPNSVMSIGTQAFEYSSNLTSVSIPNSVTSIGDEAFMFCTNLTSVSIPNSINKIGYQTFRNCSNLSTVTIPNSVTSIEWNAFKDCSALTSISIPNSVTSIGRSAFETCSGLTSITIPSSVTTIGERSFSGCSGLTSVFLGESVYGIYSNSFANCPQLKDVYCMAENVPNTNTDAFQDSYIEYATLHVLKTSINDYQSTKPWSNFKAIVDISETPHTLKYVVDNNEYKSFQLYEGEVIIPLLEPSKEGYTFSGWNNLPSVMPGQDVIVTGSFAINKYKLTYMLDSEDYKTYEVEYGSTITPELAPTKEGYTFSGWSEIPTTMPAKDVTITGSFAINKYKLIYMIDGEEYKTYEVEYGVTITPELAPTKEGYTFSGWSEIPTTMPAKDVTITGSFAINKYKLIYMVDGEEYKTYEVEYGATITPEPIPTKEGYDFSGWSTIPETMPADDVTIIGTFMLVTTDDEIIITSAGQTTWCSAYDLDFTDIEGLKAYMAEGYNRTTGTIWLMRVFEVPAGEGILLIGDAGDYTIPHKSTTTYYMNMLVGTVTAKTINETDGEYTNYYLSSGDYGVGFYKVNGSVDLKANRAYLPLLKSTVSGSRGFIGIDFDDGEDGTTGISEAQQRVGEQDVWYNLQGQRVDNPSKGLYIRNGKKVIVK